MIPVQYANVNDVRELLEINLSTQAGTFITSATAQANFGETVRWTKAAASKETVPAKGST
jgi:hypothetical protein